MKTRPELLNHPNIPKPLHGLAPRVLLGEEWWNEAREQAYKRNYYQCWACGVHKYEALFHRWLEAHETYAIDYRAGRAEMIEVVALCHACHNFIHSGRLMALLEQDQIPPGRFWAILKHGFKMLRTAGLPDNIYAREAVLAGWQLLIDCPWWVQAETWDRTPLADDAPGTARWQDWRLVLNGVEYPPLHKDYAAWKRHYSGEHVND
jgi:hypothetical protein